MLCRLYANRSTHRPCRRLYCCEQMMRRLNRTETNPVNQIDMVRTGYDRIAAIYLKIRRNSGPDIELLAELTDRLSNGARVLDAGCGAGVPVTRLLADRFMVTGVDLSASQIELARSLVPDATFIQADMTTIDLPANAFNAICSYYAIIHVPREQHPTLLERFHRMLVPGGYLLASMGATDNADDRDDNWLGAGAPMYWSHYGQEENLRMVKAAGFTIVWDRLVREDEMFGEGRHLFVLARKPLVS